MTEIVFASNNASHWPFSNTTTAAGEFDATRVPYGLKLKYNELITSPDFLTVAAGNTTWIHFRMFTDSVEYSDAVAPRFVMVFDANGDKLFEATKQGGTFDHICDIFLYDGVGTANSSMSSQFTDNAVNGVDFEYFNDGSSSYVKMYANGGLVATVNLGNTNNRGKPTSLVIGGAMVEDDQTTKFMVVSEIMISDSDTRNGRLNLLRAVTEGGETDWVGLAPSLSDDDPTTGLTTITAEERESLTLTAYVGAANISSVVVVTQAFAGANAPQNIRHTVRMEGANYDGAADIPLTPTLSYGLTHFEINPSTSLPWVEGDLPTLEIGFISKA